MIRASGYFFFISFDLIQANSNDAVASTKFFLSNAYTRLNVTFSSFNYILHIRHYYYYYYLLICIHTINSLSLSIVWTFNRMWMWIEYSVADDLIGCYGWWLWVCSYNILNWTERLKNTIIPQLHIAAAQKCTHIISIHIHECTRLIYFVESPIIINNAARLHLNALQKNIFTIH